MFGIKQLKSELISFKCAMASRNERLFDELDAVKQSISIMKKKADDLVISREALIEQKIPENCRRLNEMLLELKGLVCQIRADYQENKKERKDQKELAVQMASELLYAMEMRFDFLEKQKTCCSRKAKKKEGK